MSDNRHFIEEVNDEVRRDRLLYAQRDMAGCDPLPWSCWSAGRRWNDTTSTDRARQTTLASVYLPRCLPENTAARPPAFENIEATHPPCRVLLGMLAAAEQGEAGETDASVATLIRRNRNWTPMCPRSFRDNRPVKGLPLQDRICPQ